MGMFTWLLMIAISRAAPATCGDWVSTTVPGAPGELRDAKIEITERGALYAFWRRAATDALDVGRLTQEGWSITTVGRGHGDFALHDGRPSVVYSNCEGIHCEVHYARPLNGVWSDTLAASFKHPISTPVLSMNASGVPHAAYTQTIGDVSTVMHLSSEFGGWHRATVATSDKRLGPASLVMNAEGEPEIAYTSSHLGGRIHLAKRSKKMWAQESTGLGRGRAIQLEFGAVGANYLAYFLDGQRVAIQTPSHGWVNYGKPVEGRGVLAVDAKGAPQFLVITENRERRDLKWVRWTGRDWSVSPIATDPRGFSTATFTLDASGCPHVLYQHSGSRQTVYARTAL